MNAIAPIQQIGDASLEATIIGTFINAPHSVALYAGDLQGEWFSEEICADIWEMFVRKSNEGQKITYMGLLNELPREFGGTTIKQLLAECVSLAQPESFLPELINSLKRIWARRVLNENAQTIIELTNDQSCNPFEIARDTGKIVDELAAYTRKRRAGNMDDAIKALRHDIEHKDNLRGATTGFKSLDEKLNGYKRQQLYVIAGRTSMGKSAFIISSLRQTALAGHGVAFISLEMSEQQIMARMTSDALYDPFQLPPPTYQDIMRGNLSPQSKQLADSAWDYLSPGAFEWDATPALNMSQIAAAARKYKAKFESEGRRLDVFCIDHMGIVEPTDRYRGNKVMETSEVSKAAHNLARELDCCVVLLCQLSRKVEEREDKRPMMSDLRWSGEIEQDADVIGFLYREHYYLQNDKNADPMDIKNAEKRLEFLIRKNRAGAIEDVELHCSIKHNAIRDAF